MSHSDFTSPVIFFNEYGDAVDGGSVAMLVIITTTRYEHLKISILMRLRHACIAWCVRVLSDRSS